ncbi:hypothetical protein [Streptomyces sp. NPDC002994]|uniref:hypothetical protein n=1 Tax=Streptomyces sp. NPDC002994 TaxID=3154441 RepID=UPI0033B2A865
MSIPQWFAGQVLTADGLNARHPKLVTQVNDQVIETSTTLIDSEIIFTPEPNAVYAYELFISYSATINSDMKWAWRGTALLASFSLGYATSAASGVNTGSDVVMRRPGNTTPRVAGGSNATSPPGDFHSAYDRGTFSTDGTVAELAMQFAQNTSHADQTILRGGNQTRLLYWRIG